MKNFKLTFTFLVILLSGINSNSQWVQVNNGMGNIRVFSLLATGGDSLFAGCIGPNGIYKSTNNGTTWTQTLNNQGVYALAVNGNNIFAGTENGVYLSVNNGTTWNQTSLNIGTITSFAVNGNYIFAGTSNSFGYNGVYFSTNNGTSWDTTSLNNRAVQSLAVNGSNIFAGINNSYGVYKSTDNGTSWNQTSLNNQTVTSLVVNGNNVFAGTFVFSNSGAVWLSTDNGISWNQTSLNNQYVNELTINVNYIFAGARMGVYVSNDNGTNWIQNNDGLGIQPIIFSLCLIELNNYIFVGKGNEGVFRRPLSELTGIHQISTEIPNQFSLSQNYPNPFNPNSKIKMQIAKLSLVNLTVFDVLGREVATLVNEELKPGTYEVNFDGTNYSSGVYYYKLSAGDYTEIKKMVLMK